MFFFEGLPHLYINHYLFSYGGQAEAKRNLNHGGLETHFPLSGHPVGPVQLSVTLAKVEGRPAQPEQGSIGFDRPIQNPCGPNNRLEVPKGHRLRASQEDNVFRGVQTCLFLAKPDNNKQLQREQGIIKCASVSLCRRTSFRSLMNWDLQGQGISSFPPWPNQQLRQSGLFCTFIL